MTNNWVDIRNADLILVMGGNAAEAHPCGFKWVIEAKVKKKARLIVIDPRFTRTAAVADLFAQMRPGTDIALLGGVIHYLLSNDRIFHEYVKSYTNASFLVREDFQFEEGSSAVITRKSAATTKPPGHTSWTKTAMPRWIRQCRIRDASCS